MPLYQPPRYLFCLSNWLIMLRLGVCFLSKPDNVPSIQVTAGTDYCYVRRLSQIFDDAGPSIQPVHACENVNWGIGEGCISAFICTVSFVGFLSLLFVHHHPPYKYSTYPVQQLACSHPSMRSTTHKFSVQWHCACSTMSGRTCRLSVPPSHHRLSDPLDLSCSVLDHARTSLTDLPPSTNNTTIPSIANIALPLSSFRTDCGARSMSLA